MKRRKALASLLVVLLLLLSACASNGSSDMAEPEVKQDNSSGLARTEDSGGADREYDESAEPDDSVEANRKIIHNASMDIEAENATALHSRLSARAIALGGYEHTNDITHHEDYSVVNATYKIPAQNLQAFLTYAGEEGKIINRSLSSEDITESYYDTSLRLESARKSLEQYYRFMDNAQTLEEVLKLQGVIDSIIVNIESFEGKLRMWDSLTDMSTVTVFIRQENDPVKIEREINWSALSFDDMGDLISQGFVIVSSAVVGVLQWLAIILVAASPIWLLLLIVLWIVLKRRKKRHAALQAPPMLPELSNPPEPPNPPSAE